MTIEELKQHCIKTIKRSEAIESIPNVKITDSRGLQEHKMVLQLIEVWENIKNDIKGISENPDYKPIGTYDYVKGSEDCRKVVLEIIDKHLSKVSE